MIESPGTLRVNQIIPHRSHLFIIEYLAVMRELNLHGVNQRVIFDMEVGNSGTTAGARPKYNAIAEIGII